MNILYFTWYENSKDDMEYALSALGCNYKIIAYEIKNYDTDPALEAYVQAEINSGKYNIILSFNYIPILSAIAMNAGIKYISWVYDCPHYTLYSKSITNSCNYIFIFDRNLMNTISSLGAQHVYHMPLAVNTKRLDSQLKDISEHYDYDISFVGSLYESSSYDRISNTNDHMLGFLDAIINIQHLIYGTNLVYDMLTPDKVLDLDRNLNISLGNDYYTDKSILLGDIINKQITSYDRITALNSLARKYNTHLFTGSNISVMDKVVCHGYISYMNEMPVVFRTSRINLNITLRSITSGIPLRVLDILGAGGFLLCNYQPEVAEYFENGIDLVMYEDDNDLINKVGYYLAHEEERKIIAANGHHKVTRLFNYISVVDKIFKLVN